MDLNPKKKLTKFFNDGIEIYFPYGRLIKDITKGTMYSYLSNRIIIIKSIASLESSTEKCKNL